MTKRQRARIAQRIREVRGELTQVEFSKLVGVTQQHVSRYEYGESLPSVGALVTMAEARSVSIDWILFGD